ncbi:MAG: nucleotidyl transferase AbiEii/AbiGii toxin family protein [Clostridiales Family XIII bacterium]|jgi:predicted nucleotidyltransferase component of viral defense system|nr:nucleotidyl transferase AbiEii/AbiGii toxin family protein [Clostridiales Family XIII bacterium]
MMTKNPMQLKAFLKRKAKEKGIPAQLVLQNYLMERLLDRIARSRYQRNFILKGGFLIAAIVGLDARTTMDIDTTIKGFDLTHENIERIFREICMIQAGDDFTFSIDRIADIREADDYPGIRLHLIASYPPINGWLMIDITAGDVITPKEIEYCIPSMFDDAAIPFLAYSSETILAEKLETLISRSTANTRMRDFYDIYLFVIAQRITLDMIILGEALAATAAKRNSKELMNDHSAILAKIKNDSYMNSQWGKYTASFKYAEKLSFGEIIDAAEKILRIIIP